MFNRRKIAQILSKTLKACTAMLLLLFYVLSSANLESFHDFFHEHPEAVLHSTNHEADPCHVAVYHQEQTGGCEHVLHLTKEDSCSLCDWHLNNVHIPNDFKITLYSFSALAEYTNVKTQAREGNFYYTSDRAPPLV